MTDQKEYEKAIKNAEFRESFIKSIKLGEVEKYLSIVYLRRKNSNIMETRMPVRNFRHEKSNIFIYPGAFDLTFHPSFADFYSTLVYHEGYHAEENFHGPPMPLNISKNNLEYWTLFNCLEEVRAIRNQLNNLTSENSEIFKNRIDEELSCLLEVINEFGKPNLVKKYINLQ